MENCPRCGNSAEKLHPLPVEALPGGGSEGEREACRWCLHEINEG